VQRQSILDAEHAIAELLAQRDSLNLRYLSQNEDALRARITQLWQTRMLRTSKLTVQDEVQNALSYYQTTFLREIPQLYRQLEQSLGGEELPVFFRMGSWIGGDRDGNPFVTADVTLYAAQRQAEVAFAWYGRELDQLYRELSLSARRVKVSEALTALASHSPDHTESRQEDSICYCTEKYRNIKYCIKRKCDEEHCDI
jgi:phosphoenolpyruvate carboxylase